MPASRSTAVSPRRFWMEPLERRTMLAGFQPVIHSTPLLSDSAAVSAPRNDANLVNPIGIATVGTKQLWVANNGTGVMTTYNTAGAPQPSATAQLVVSIPAAAINTPPTPTGIVQHSGPGFAISGNGRTLPSTFIIATSDGLITGWNAGIDPAHAATVIDHASTGDVFKGLAILGSGSSARIYATDFHNSRIEVFNSRFEPVHLSAKAFTDIQVPAGYAPFGISALRGKLYVTYARQDATHTNDNPGPAQGIVDEYNANGKLINRVGTGGDLNSPWGMAITPPSWGGLRNDLLVANQGDGTLNLFDRKNNFLGQVLDPNAPISSPLTVDGLWGLSTGSGSSRNTIFYTAGPNLQSDGLLGTLTATRPPRAHK